MTAVQPAVAWVVSWQRSNIRGPLAFLPNPGEAGSIECADEQTAELEAEKRRVAGYVGVVVWTMQVVA